MSRAAGTLVGMRALVIADGVLPSPALLRSLAAGADVVVATDGAGDKAIAAGVVPDVVLGDLDSLSMAARDALPPGSVLHVEDVNTTDLQKAIAWCEQRGAARVDVTGAGGGRADHALANLAVLCSDSSADVRIVDDLFEVRRVVGEAQIDAPPGTVVSLVAIGACEGVSTDGLRWPLTDYPMRFSPYGIHNEVERSPAFVRVRAGDLLLFEGRWQERHRG